jgi:alpha-D-xyloside xylohydrolase
LKNALTLFSVAGLFILAGCVTPNSPSGNANLPRALALQSSELSHTDIASRSLVLDGLFFETAQGRSAVPPELSKKILRTGGGQFENQATMPDGRVVKISIQPDGDNFNIHLTAQPDADITKWGFAVDAASDEYFTGLMERVVDGPQQNSWAPDIQETLNLRGQKVDMILKPTMSVYAPYYISSRGYAVFVQGNWPGFFDFCASDTNRVKIEFEGPSFAAKIYTARNPATLVCRHALDAGPPFVPPKWMYTPWRWRDENTQRKT